MSDEIHVWPRIGAEREVHPDALAAELAARQHGVVSRAQLSAVGLGRRSIGHRLDSGRLHSVHRGVFAVGHRRLTQRGIWMAGVLTLGDGAALTHRAGGALYGIHHYAGCEVTVPRNRRPRDGIVVHIAKLPDDEVTVVDGIPVTTAARTLFDLASVLSFTRLERAFAQAENRRLTGSLSVLDLLARYPGARGAASLRRIIAHERLGEGVTLSEFEDRFLELLDEAGLPRPVPNALVLGERRDHVWPEQRLVVELDSRQWHDTNRAFDDDRARDRALVVADWRTVRITWRQLVTDPAGIVRDLRMLLSRFTFGPV